MDARVHWVPDEAVTHCKGCGLRFDVLNRKHHCRVCGDIFCDSCSNYSVSVKLLDLRGGRACRSCHLFVSEKMPLLLAETPFRKLDEGGGDPYEIRLRVSSDQERLLWKSKMTNFSATEQAGLDSFNRVIEGQTSAGFEDAKPNFLLAMCFGPGITALEDSSFSLEFYNGFTLDLVALSPQARDAWIDAFREFAARHVSNANEAIRNAKRSAEQQAKLERQESIRTKHKAMADKYKTKYGSLN